MTVFHISPVYNRLSIRKNGIIPSRIEHEVHLKAFKKDGLCTEDDKCIYTWQYSIHNEKFIRDMVFCKVWIEPRNKIYSPEGRLHYLSNKYFDFRTILNKNLYQYGNMIYDVYAIEVLEAELPWMHLQEPSDSITNTLYHMSDAYAHNNKRLHIYKKALKNFEIVGSTAYYCDNNRYHIKIIN